MLKQGLQQSQLQKLSPQQIQFIKLLQLNSVDILQRIDQELIENPALLNATDPDAAPDETAPISENAVAFNDISVDKIPAIILGASTNTSSINDTSKIPPIKPDINDFSVDEIPIYKYK